MTNSRQLDNHQIDLQENIKFTLEILDIGIDDLNSRLSEFIQELGIPEKYLVDKLLLAPSFATKVCKNMIPYLKENDPQALSRNFDDIILKSWIELCSNRLTPIPTHYTALAFTLDKMGDILITQDEMKSIDTEINALNNKMKTTGLSRIEKQALQEYYSIKYGGLVLKDIFKLPQKILGGVSEGLYTISSSMLNYIKGTHTTEKIIPTITKQPDTASVPDVTPPLRNNTNDSHNKILQIQKRIAADLSYENTEMVSRPISDQHLYQPIADDKIHPIWDKYMSGGSLQISNNNRSGQTRWHVDLPLPAGLVVLGVKFAIGKIKELRHPNEINRALRCIELYADSHNQASIRKPKSLLSGMKGIRNFATKNFHRLSKNELIQQRQTEALCAIENVCRLNPDNFLLKKEFGYLISAIKNNNPKIISEFLENRDFDSHKQLVSHHTSCIERDMEDLISTIQDPQKFDNLAKMMQDKYPHESSIHKAIAEIQQIKAQPVIIPQENKQLALKSTSYTKLMLDNLNAIQKRELAKREEQIKQQIFTDRIDATLSILLLMISFKLLDHKLSQSERKILNNLTHMISSARMMIPKPSLNNTSKSLHSAVAVLSLINFIWHELQDRKIIEKTDEKTQLKVEAAITCVSMAPVIYDVIQMIKNPSLISLGSIACTASFVVSTGMHGYNLYCRYNRYALPESFSYHALANTAAILPSVYIITSQLGVLSYATGSIAAGIAIAGVEPITGTILIVKGTAICGALSIATYKGIEYKATYDTAKALAYNAEIYAEKNDFVTAIKKLDESLEISFDHNVLMMRALYNCQNNFNLGKYDLVAYEARKWSTNPELEIKNRLHFLNYRIKSSILNNKVSHDIDELWGMYVAFTDNKPSDKEVSKDENALKQNMSSLLCKSATETTDLVIAMKNLDHANNLTPGNESIIKMRRNIEYEYDYKQGNQSALIEKCISSLDANEHDGLALKYSGLLAIQQGKFGLSQQYLNAWSASEPDSVHPHLYLAHSAMCQEDYVAAKIHAANAMTLSQTLYDKKQQQSLQEDSETINSELQALEEQYTGVKENYSAIQKGITSLYTCSLAQAAGRISAEAAGMMIGNIKQLFTTDEQRYSTSHLSYSMWRKPESYGNSHPSQINHHGFTKRYF